LFLAAPVGQAEGMSESINPEDVASYDDVSDQPARNSDPVSSLRDTEEEQGDETETTDDFDMDSEEAQELGVNLDRVDGETPRLD
jgi:hypothetical protein